MSYPIWMDLGPDTSPSTAATYWLSTFPKPIPSLSPGPLMKLEAQKRANSEQKHTAENSLTPSPQASQEDSPSANLRPRKRTNSASINASKNSSSSPGQCSIAPSPSPSPSQELGPSANLRTRKRTTCNDTDGCHTPNTHQANVEQGKGGTLTASYTSASPQTFLALLIMP